MHCQSIALRLIARPLKTSRLRFDARRGKLARQFFESGFGSEPTICHNFSSSNILPESADIGKKLAFVADASRTTVCGGKGGNAEQCEAIVNLSESKAKPWDTQKAGKNRGPNGKKRRFHAGIASFRGEIAGQAQF
jgi:hypothetical protein